jgi:hypothetical protein
MKPARLTAAALVLLLAVPARAVDNAPPLGFTVSSFARQREVEAALLALPSAARCEAQHAELTRAEGLPGRPWLRHLVYAPLPSYAAETLPGVREAVLAKDSARVSAEAGHLAQALRQAADRLEAVAGQ